MIWIGCGFVMAAAWGFVSVVNKRLLEDVHPIPLNFLVRVVTIAGLTLTTVTLTVSHAWPYGFGINGAAVLYIAASASVTWLLAFTAYYYALRAGRVGVVVPVSSTDPLWTALFAVVMLGAVLRLPTLAGMAVTLCGVVLISRWMDEGSAAPGQVDGELVPPVEGAGRERPAPGGGALTVVGLSLVAAAGWGISPVLIQLAEQSYGAPSAFMMVESQAIGVLSLGAWVLARRAPLFTRRLTGPALRHMLLLLLASGALEVVYSVLYYLVIDRLGPVLAMLLSATAPVFGVLAGVLLLKERLSARLAFAVALTLGGVFLAVAARLF